MIACFQWIVNLLSSIECNAISISYKISKNWLLFLSYWYCDALQYFKSRAHKNYVIDMISHRFNTISDIWKLGIKWNFHGKLWHIFIEYHTYFSHNRSTTSNLDRYCKADRRINLNGVVILPNNIYNFYGLFTLVGPWSLLGGLFTHF